ncbi:hypothetical protein JKP88DRAFT_219973, partial [Tribonema minus]
MVEGWVRKQTAALQGADLLVIPICHESHWVVVIIDRKQQELVVYDSLCSASRPPGAQRLVQMEEMHELLLMLYSTTPSGATIMATREPFLANAKCQQTNNKDCGVFACANAWCHIYQKQFFTQRDIGYFRQYMLHILSTHLARCIGPEP